MKAKEYVKRRNHAFENDDIEWAAQQCPGASSREVVEMAFHKARLDALGVSDEKRLESQRWLAERGLKDLIGRPVSIGDELRR